MIFEKVAKLSPKNLDFSGHQKYFWVDTWRNYGPFTSKNNCQTVLKQLSNNLEKSQNLSKKYAHPPPTHPLNKGHGS